MVYLKDGQKKRFAEAIISARPVKISNREAALLIGCTEGSASATGSRCMADPRVREYIRHFWPNYFGDFDNVSDELTGETNIDERKQSELPLFCVQEISKWLETHADVEDLSKISELLVKIGCQSPEIFNGNSIAMLVQKMEKDSEEFKNIVQTVVKKMRATTNPIELYDSIMLDPFASVKEKPEAASLKAKKTIANPASVNKKDAAREQAMLLRQNRRQVNSVGDFYPEELEQARQTYGVSASGGGKRWN